MISQLGLFYFLFYALISTTSSVLNRASFTSSSQCLADRSTDRSPYALAF